MSVGIGAADDRGDCNDGRITIKAMFVDEGVEAATFADVRVFDTRHVERGGSGFVGDADDLVRRHEQKLRLLVDKA
ncbi:hypothetical protein SB2_31250 [Methylobacterium radiotolerans]|nr:hypothetical protein SB2_31250 [Methylobacterium radiotolerans]